MRYLTLPPLFLLIAAAAMAVQGCGQTGDLYRPGDVEAERRAKGSDTQDAIDQIDTMREAEQADRVDSADEANEAP